MSTDVLTTEIDTQGSGTQSWADWAGMTASIGCAIHCAAMPLVIAYLPALGLSWLADEGFHQWMALICFALAALAFLPGWRAHRSLLPVGFGLAGVFLLTFAAYGLEEGCCPSCAVESNESATASACTDPTCTLCKAEEEVTIETPEAKSLTQLVTPFLTPLGGVLLVVGHLSNHRKKSQCQCQHCCQPDDSVES